MEDQLMETMKDVIHKRFRPPLFTGLTLSEAQGDEAKKMIDKYADAIKEDIDRCVHPGYVPR